MYCPSCGTPNADGSKFCVKCGKAVPTLDTSSQPIVQPDVASISRNKAVRAGIVTIALIATCIVAIILITQNQPTTSVGTIALSVTPLPLEKSGKIVFSTETGLSIMNADGTNIRALPVRKIDTRNPAWSPDSRQIAYEAYTGHEYRIFTIGADGSNLQQATNTTGNDSHPAWSPDGRWIVFASTGNGVHGIFLAEVNGVQIKQLTSNNAYQPDWSPDGRQIVFTFDKDLYVMNADGGQPTRLVSGGSNARWSPDSSKLAFNCSPSANSTQICIVNADGSQLIRLTQRQDSAYDPAWSPDGTRLAFRSGSSIFVMTIDGSNTAEVSQAAGRGTGLDWSPGY